LDLQVAVLAMSNLFLVCFGIFALPTANALNRLLRRQGSSPSFPKRQTLELPDDLDSLFSENSQALLAELMGQTSMIGFSLTALSMPTTTTTTRQELSGCHSAYVYCGQGISTCSPEGGWMIDVSAVDRESGFHLQCELRIGEGRCMEGVEYELSLDLPLGSFEITEETLHSEIFDSTLGMVGDISLLFAGGGPVRRLSQGGTETLGPGAGAAIGAACSDDWDCASNRCYRGLLPTGACACNSETNAGCNAGLFCSDELTIADGLPECVGEDRTLELLISPDSNPSTSTSSHFYHHLAFNLGQHNVVLGGGLSSQHVSIFATVCPCEGKCENNSDSPSDAPSDNIPSSVPTLTPVISTTTPSSAQTGAPTSPTNPQGTQPLLASS